MPVNTYVHVYVKAPVVVRITSIPTPLTSDNLLLKGDDNPELVYSFDNVEDPTSFEEEVLNLSADPNPDPAPPVIGLGCKAEFYAGFRLSTLIYGDKVFRNKLGLYYFEDLVPADRKLSYKFVRNSNDIIAMEFLSTLSVMFKAESDTSLYDPWGKNHRGSLVYSPLIPLSDVRDILYAQLFKIGPNNIKYKVMPNSIVKRYSRKSRIIGN